MSNMSEFHNTVVYDPKTTKAFAGQRLSKHSWKTDKETGVKPESKAVSIPTLRAEVTASAALQSHIIGYLESVQDAMIKELIVAGTTQIHDEQINVEAMVEWLEAESSGTRLTKQDATKWFEDTIEDTLALVLATKLGVSEVPTENESKQIFAIVGEFKNKITSLAGGKTSYTPQVAERLIKALDLVEDKEDAILSRFLKRLEKMKESTAEIDLLNAL